MAQLKNLRHFNQSEKSEAIAQIAQFIKDNSDLFELEEGETAEAIATECVEKAALDKAVDLFNQKAMVKHLASKAKQVLQKMIDEE